MNEDIRLRSAMIHLGYFTLLLTSAFIMYLFYLSMWPIQIVKLNEFKMISKEVKRGETFSYYMNFDKLRNYKSETRYYLVDGIILRLSEEGVQRKPGTHKIISERRVPTVINPGRYRLRIEIDYRILPWRTMSYIWETDTFAIK